MAPATVAATPPPSTTVPTTVKQEATLIVTEIVPTPSPSEEKKEVRFFYSPKESFIFTTNSVYSEPFPELKAIIFPL
jgi:hypothetical protein